MKPEDMWNGSIQDLASHTHTVLEKLLWSISDGGIVEDKLTAATFVELRMALRDIARIVEGKVKPAISEAEHDTTWNDDDDDTSYTHQRAEYFHGVAPGGRL